MRRAARVAGQLFNSSGAVRDLAGSAAKAAHPVTAVRRIAVMGVRGGCGKSTVASLVGSVFAVRRRDEVLAFDADPDMGSLAWRLGVQDSRGLAEIGPTVLRSPPTHIADLHRLLPRTPTGLWVVPGATTYSQSTPGAATADVVETLSRLFAVTVIDCGASPNTPTTAAVLGRAHALIVATAATPDGVRSIQAMLEWASRVVPHLSTRAVIVMSSLNPKSEGVHLGRAHAILADYGPPVHHLAYDRHLAAGAAINLAQVAEATSATATHIAADALTCAFPKPPTHHP